MIDPKKAESARAGYIKALTVWREDQNGELARKPNHKTFFLTTEEAALLERRELHLAEYIQDFPGDAALLDFLGTQEVADRDNGRPAGWQLRESSTGRGCRLLTTSRKPNYQTPRQAIAAAMRDGLVTIQ